MSWLRKAADWVRVLSVREPQHWRNEEAVAHSGEAVTERSVLAISAAWACVNLLAGTMASLPLMVYRTDSSGGRTVASDHPLYRLLHDSPNADQTALDFWEFGCVKLELRGDMHARITRSGSRIVALTPIGADVMARRLPSGAIGYSWSENGRSFVDVAQEEIFHVRGFGGSPLGGLSTLSYGRNSFGLATAIDKASGATFRNGLRPFVQFVFEKFLTPEQRATAEAGIQAKYVGAANAGKPFIAEGGMKLEAISITPADAQMLQQRGMSVEDVCRFFGVPPFMIGHTEKTTSWGTGLTEQVMGFQKFTLRRRLRRIEQAAMKQLLTAADRAAGIVIEFNIEGLLRGDGTARSAFYGSALNNGWMTINEVRAFENLPPVAGGEVPRMQIQNVPITQAGQVQTIAAPAPTI